MSQIKFYMAGSGDWRRWFQDERAHNLYERLYPNGLQFADLEDHDQAQVTEWEKPDFVKNGNGLIIPQIPIFTDSDDAQLSCWFAQITEQACEIIAGRSMEYRSLAAFLSDGGRIPEDYLFTILICAHTLDLGTLNRLQAGIMGEPPKRERSGSYFFWGETATRDLTNFFGVNSYGILSAFTLSVMWSPAIKRAIPNQKSLTIPVFDSSAMTDIQTLCTSTSEKLAKAFSESLTELKEVMSRCSFKACPLNDVLCMIFHIGYGLVTDLLVKKGLLPKFPSRANDAWGIWIRAQ